MKKKHKKTHRWVWWLVALLLTNYITFFLTFEYVWYRKHITLLERMVQQEEMEEIMEEYWEEENSKLDI